MPGLTHIVGSGLGRATTARFAFGSLLAAGLVLWCAHATAYADASKAEAARDRARKAIRADDWTSAERLIRKGLKTGKKAERDAWHVVDSELAYARKRYAKSGLIAMRIVILRPKSGQVGAALYRAARAYEGLGRLEKAAELCRACIEHKTTRNALRKKAEKRLKKLTERRPKS